MAEDRRRDFDFWIGDWEVSEPDGTIAGRNRIEPLFDGMVLAEHWEGDSGLRGASYNLYAAARGHWHQTWVDSSGSLLLLDGGLRDGAMVMEGTMPSREDPGAMVHHRITWSVTHGDADRLRQHWEASRDGGSTWDTVFDGRYRRVDSRHS